jgi:hypothetical protein
MSYQFKVKTSRVRSVVALHAACLTIRADTLQVAHKTPKSGALIGSTTGQFIQRLALANALKSL